MHTVMVVGGGLIVLAVFVLGAVVLGKPAAAGARFFILPWLVVALVNLYVGTTHGHSVVGELPFLAVVSACLRSLLSRSCAGGIPVVQPRADRGAGSKLAPYRNCRALDAGNPCSAASCRAWLVSTAAGRHA